MLTVAIPTYQREAVLLQTLAHVMAQVPPPGEILVVDQTARHEAETERRLAEWQAAGAIVWLRQAEPSVTQAMNSALASASNDIVLFVDDDVLPEAGLIAAHLEAHRRETNVLVAGRIIQPWQEGVALEDAAAFHFAQTKQAWIGEFMGGNFSVDCREALALGGFDENFVRVAYRFEAEFAWRWRRSGRRILFEPDACLHHLKAPAGGTRSFGQHLTSYRPDHAVGAYYFLLRTVAGPAKLAGILSRPIRAVANRHHLRAPWWIPATLLAELSGMIWAVRLAARGPRYAGPRPDRLVLERGCSHD